VVGDFVGATVIAGDIVDDSAYCDRVRRLLRDSLTTFSKT
jgi:hypothetical protein